MKSLESKSTAFECWFQADVLFGILQTNYENIRLRQVACKIGRDKQHKGLGPSKNISVNVKLAAATIPIQLEQDKKEVTCVPALHSQPKPLFLVVRRDLERHVTTWPEVQTGSTNPRSITRVRNWDSLPRTGWLPYYRGSHTGNFLYQV